MHGMCYYVSQAKSFFNFYFIIMSPRMIFIKDERDEADQMLGPFGSITIRNFNQTEDRTRTLIHFLNEILI